MTLFATSKFDLKKLLCHAAVLPCVTVLNLSLYDLYLQNELHLKFPALMTEGLIMHKNLNFKIHKHW